MINIGIMIQIGIVGILLDVPRNTRFAYNKMLRSFKHQKERAEINNLIIVIELIIIKHPDEFKEEEGQV